MKKRERDAKRSKEKKKQVKDEEGSESDGNEEAEEIERLNQRIIEITPALGSQATRGESLRFDSLPLSKPTLNALAAANLTVATDIQAAAIPHALAGRDILGAAKTGSGKTLAFLIPLVEKLYRERWSDEDGLAAIIITPTRELALQIFDVLRVVGKQQQLSAGIVTGGKTGFEDEQERVLMMNILVATPGRLLQHLQQTPGFDASKLQMLVLDEADRILDLGFRSQLDQILEYLPSRQTLLFSATQTKSVKDLARLSLVDPQYLAVHEHDAEVTPSKLIQNYVVVKLQDKLDVLFSFIKSHLQSKIIVFFSTCSQVRFVHECFRGMQPGIPLTALHGKLKQERRTIIFMDFNRRKSACMFATDLAARGLDFPEVDWVIQVDAPEDAAMYIHRVGRTARFTASGRAMLMLLPSEERVIVPVLSDAGVPIKKLTVNPKYTVSVSAHAAALLVAQPECKQLAKKAFVGYLRSLQLMPHRELQDLSQLPVDEFAVSLGLGFTPPVPVMAPTSTGDAGRAGIREGKNVNWSLDKLRRQIKEAKEEKKRLRAEAAAAAAGVAAPTIPKLVTEQGMKTAAKGHHEDDDELFTVKAVQKPDGSDDEDDGELDGTALLTAAKKSKSAKIKIRGDGTIRAMRDAGAKKVTYTEDGEVAPSLQLVRPDGEIGAHEKTSKMTAQQIERAEKHAQIVKARLDSVRLEDHERDRQRVKGKHKELRQRLKADRNVDDADDDDGGGVVLGRPDDDSDYGEGMDHRENEDLDFESEERAMNDEVDDVEYSERSTKKGKGKSKGKQPLRQAKRRRTEPDTDDIAYHEQLALQLLDK